jgi:hypothetical protein
MTDTKDRSDDLIVKKNLEYKQHYRLAEYVKPIVSIQGFKGRPQPYMKFPPYANELKRQQQQLSGQQQQQQQHHQHHQHHQQQQQMLHLHKSSTQDRCMLNNNTQRNSLNDYYSNSQHHGSNDFCSDNKIGRDRVMYQCDYIIKDDDDPLNIGDGDSSHVHDDNDNDNNRRSHSGTNYDKRRRVSKNDCTMNNKINNEVINHYGSGTSSDKRRRMSKKDCTMNYKINNEVINHYDPDNSNHHDHDMDDDDGGDNKLDSSNDHFNDCTYILSMMVEVDISGLLKLISCDKKYYCSLHNLGNKNSKNSGRNDNTFIVDGDDDYDRGNDDDYHIDDGDGDDDHQGGDDSIAEIVHSKWVDGRIIQITKLSVRQKGEDFLLRIRFRNGAEWDIKSSLNLVRVHRHGRGNDRSNSSGDSSSGSTRVGCGSSNSGNRGSGAIDTEHEDHDYKHYNDIEINYDTNNIHVRVDDYHGDNCGIDHCDSGLDSHSSQHNDNHKSTLPIFNNTITSKYRNIVDLLLNDKVVVGGGNDEHDEHDDFEHLDDDDDEFNFDDDSDVDISNAFDYGNNNQFLLSNMISCCGVNSTTDGDSSGISNTCNNININDNNDNDHHENQDDANDDDDDDDAIFNISTKKVIDKLTNTDRRHHHHQHQSLLATGEYVSTNILEEIDSYFKRNLRLNVITLPKPRMNVDEYCKLLQYVITVIRIIIIITVT